MPHAEAEIRPLEAGPNTAGGVVMALQRSKKRLLAGFAVIGFVVMLTQFAGYVTVTR